MLAPSLGRPELRFGREGFPQVQILEDRSASAKPLRETPSPCDHLQGVLEPSPTLIQAKTSTIFPTFSPFSILAVASRSRSKGKTESTTGLILPSRR
jgi:hypothetical protein